MPAGTEPMTAEGIDECWREIGVSGDRSCPELDEHLHCRNCPTHAQIARKLLDRPLPPGYREEWTRHFAERDEKTPEDEEVDSVLIFRIGEEWLGLPAAICREIAEPRPVHSLPHRRSEAVRGIVNVRGELLICVSLPALLGIGATSPFRGAGRIAVFPRLVVTGEDARHVAFEVDEVHGLHAWRAHECGAVPATVGRSAASVVAAMIPWEGRAVGRLDAQRLLDLIDRSIA